MDDSKRWEESDSQQFISMSDIVVPSRAEQMDIITSLIPAEEDEWFMAADLASGEGLLSKTIMDRFPNCQMTLLDGSESMLTTAAENLGDHGLRIDLRLFDLKSTDWLDELSRRYRGIVSSLAIHHLSGTEKQALYARLSEHLVPGGALIIADLVEPVNELAQALYAAHWDEIVRVQSLQYHGDLSTYQEFQDGWNHYEMPDEEFDTPSGLYEQLRWLDDAGFEQVDCFWMRAGHAIFGGFKAGDAVRG